MKHVFLLLILFVSMSSSAQIDGTYASIGTTIKFDQGSQEFKIWSGTSVWFIKGVGHYSINSDTLLLKFEILGPVCSPDYLIRPDSSSNTIQGDSIQLRVSFLDCERGEGIPFATVGQKGADGQWKELGLTGKDGSLSVKVYRSEFPSKFVINDPDFIRVPFDLVPDQHYHVIAKTNLDGIEYFQAGEQIVWYVLDDSNDELYLRNEQGAEFTLQRVE